MTSPYDPVARPTPLRDAFRTVGGAVSVVGSVVVFFASWGVLSSEQANAANALLAAVPTVITLVTGLAASFGIVAKAEPQVTPVSNPQDNDGVRLVPATLPEG